MSEDFIVAVLLCCLAAGAIIVAAVFAFKQKAYVDSTGSEVTDIEVPLLGKLKTNVPAIALCFLAVVLGYFAYDGMKGRVPKLVTFRGEVAVDRQALADPGTIAVGMVSNAWNHTSSLDNRHELLVFDISVPNSWSSYSAYAFTFGGTKTKPTIVGTSLDSPRFQLRVGP